MCVKAEALKYSGDGTRSNCYPLSRKIKAGIMVKAQLACSQERNERARDSLLLRVRGEL